MVVTECDMARPLGWYGSVSHQLITLYYVAWYSDN